MEETRSNRSAQAKWYAQQKSTTPIIYLMLNNMTGDVYVGRTTNSLKKRLQQHRAASKDTKRASKLYKDMREWGAENFSITEVYRCAEDECPKEAESKQISILMSELNTNIHCV